MGCVYKITNTINNKCYIGVTKHTFRKRYNCRDDWWNATRVNRHLKNAVNKYGPEFFIVEILETCEKEKLEVREKYYIEFYNSYENGYNLTSGGFYNYEVSEESKRKNSEINKKRYENGAVTWNKGKKLSESHKKRSSETKKKNYNSGKTIPWNKGKKTGRPSEQAILNSAKAHMKRVDCYKDGKLVKTYESQKETKKDGFNPAQVSLCCNNKARTHRGHVFKFTNNN